MDRRHFVGVGVAGIAAAVVAGRRLSAARVVSSNDGRLQARPRKFTPPGGKVVTGTSRLGMGGARDGVLFVPESYSSATPAPLMLALHGATGAGDRFARNVTGLASQMGMIVVAPDSRSGTWDAIRGYFDDDVVFIDQVLARVFSDFNIDAKRLTIAGFSDGATYALSLGLVNGDLFGRIAAFSPGFIVPGTRHGKPAVFVSHGHSDPILPFSGSSERIVPELRKTGYAVTFVDFDGGHAVAPEVIQSVGPWLRG